MTRVVSRIFSTNRSSSPRVRRRRRRIFSIVPSTRPRAASPLVRVVTLSKIVVATRAYATAAPPTSFSPTLHPHPLSLFLFSSSMLRHPSSPAMRIRTLLHSFLHFTHLPLMTVVIVRLFMFECLRWSHRLMSIIFHRGTLRESCGTRHGTHVHLDVSTQSGR